MFNFLRHKKVIAKNGKDLYKTFQKTRRQLLRLSLISIGITLLALAIVGTKLFYPFHVVIGVGLYLLSFIPLFRRMYLSRRTWQKYKAYSWSKSFFKREWIKLVYAGLFICFTLTVFWLRPMDERPFADLTNDQVMSLVSDDMYRSVTAMDYLETTGNELLSLLESNRSDPNLNEDLTRAFSTFLEAVTFSESLTEQHRYFASLPYSLWEERVSSFLISYSLYIKKYELVHRVMFSVSDDEKLKKILNQHIETVDKGLVYSEMISRFYEPKTRLRISGGYLYMKIFARSDEKSDQIFSMLRNKAVGSYDYLKDNFVKTVLHSGEVFTDNVEQKMFDTWFPIQKTVATGMGRAIISTRGKAGLITSEQAIEMQKFMQPGDIMLQRRNWHVSNVGIPGFWTHSAIYTGDLDTLNKYFASEFPYQGHDDLSSYLETHLPLVYENYIQLDSDGSSRSVVEAIEPGVVLQSLPISANADFVVTLRPNLEKRDTLLAVLRALESFGKPYDFDFDFDTRDALVCSELVYDAYLERESQKAGLHMETSIVNGRPVVSPMDIANKFVYEYKTADQSIDFVYLLKGDEESKTAEVGTEADFRDSINWSKFSFLQN